MTYIDARGKQLEAITYSEALLKMHALGVHNQIDEHDIAGEEALYDQRIWQQQALDTVETFVNANRVILDAIGAERHAFEVSTAE